MKDNPKELQDIQLRNGDNVTVSWKSKNVCKCGMEIWYAVKGNDYVTIELVSLAQWDLHICKEKIIDLIK
jgi:hypothetical protein